VREKLFAAFLHCRKAMLSILATYVIGACVGGLMVHTGNSLALDRRDQVVSNALATDPATLQLQKGNRGTAALLDFAENVLMGAVPQTLMGIAVVPAYVSVAYQGWVGGIVSFDSRHRSRLAAPVPATYFILTLALQFMAYSAAVGAGVQAGIDLYRINVGVGLRFWAYTVPKTVAQNILYVYVLAVPVFLLASALEFLWPFGR
jgi:hypothetical protein